MKRVDVMDGLKVKLLADFKKKLEYSPKENVCKQANNHIINNLLGDI